MMHSLTSTSRRVWLVAAGVIISTGCAQSAQDPPTVVVQPGQNVQQLVDNFPEGTRFLFQPGIYRQQAIRPKNRQQFIGQDGVILNGAMELKRWTYESGLWRHENLPEPLPFRGSCGDGGDLCGYREDLFLDGRLYRRVATVDELGPGTWYYADRRAYLRDDPTGHLVELGVTPRAFGGDAEDVVLKDLIVEKYASNAQDGAIYANDGRGWLISDVTARWNHGAGLSFASQAQVTGGSFSHNGQLGISGSRGEGSRIEGMEIAFNNYAGYDPGWEGGGTKFGAATGLIVRNTCVHHNDGPGLWTDYDNIHTLYEGNRIFLNAKEGIKHEISYDAIIRDNIVAGNGKLKDNWLWGAQIIIQNSSNVEVYRNLVEVSADFGNGITVVHQDRGEGAHGPWHAVRNTVHGNTIVHLGGRGRNGVVTDEDDDSYWTEAANRFDRNSYIVPDGAVRYWTSRDRNARWDNVEELGFEQNGELIVEARAPIELSCAR